MARDGTAIVLGMSYTILVIMAWILAGDPNHPFDHLLISCPFLILLIPGSLLFLIFGFSSNLATYGRMGFYFSLPVWIYSIFFHAVIPSYLAFFEISLVACGALLYWRALKPLKEPTYHILREGVALGMALSIISGLFLLGISLIGIVQGFPESLGNGLINLMNSMLLLIGGFMVLNVHWYRKKSFYECTFHFKLAGYFALGVGAVSIVMILLIKYVLGYLIPWSLTTIFTPFAYTNMVFGRWGIYFESSFAFLGGLLLLLFATNAQMKKYSLYKRLILIGIITLLLVIISIITSPY